MTTKVGTTMLKNLLVGEVTISAPATGATVALTSSPYIANNVIKPAGTLAALTLTIGDGTLAGQQVNLACTQIITTLTLSGSNWGSTAMAQPSALTANQALSWVWSASAGKWLRTK